MNRSKLSRPKHSPDKARLKRAGIITLVLLFLALILFAEVIRPNQDAKSYTQRLEASSKPLQICFDDLTKTTGLKIYYAPDIDLKTKQQDAATINKEIAICRKELNDFTKTSQQLLTLHFAGYTKIYRDAKVSQRQATDLIGQSSDVLSQYSKLATFLANYYNHIEAFTSYTAALANGNDFFPKSRIQTLAAQTKDLRSRATQVRQLASPAEFNTTKSATADMFSAAADGFNNLVIGYTQGNDFTVTTGYAQIDKAMATYDSSVINMPFDHLTKSYIPQQVSQLPGKVENLLAADSE